MSIQFKIADQVLKMPKVDSDAEDIIAKYSSFLAAMSSDRYRVQRGLRWRRCDSCFRRSMSIWKRWLVRTFTLHRKLLSVATAMHS